VWTESGPYAYFDEENGWPAPGFRLGFPVIQERTFNAQAGADMYLLLTPDGGRVELRQTSGGTFEAVDSSYLQLVEGGTTLTLRTTDGTEMLYQKVQSEWRCTQIKDRHGNYLTVTYQWWGGVNQVTDTLGRVVTFNYDNYQKLVSITQAWGGESQQWAGFEYANQTITMTAGGLSLVGIRQGQQWPLLNRLHLPDESYYQFVYNSQGQVTKIERYAGNNNKLNHLNYTINGGTLSDRVSQAAVWADDWNGEVETLAASYAAPVSASWTVPYNNVVKTGLKSVITTPDGVESRLYFGETGWQRGLGMFTETVANNAVQRWTATDWEADSNTLLNPRVTESNVGDPQGNRRRATVSYTSYGLPADVREWTGVNAATVYRRTHTDYNLDSAYLANRIIGLPSAVHVYEGEDTALVSKVTYFYDDVNWGGYLEATPAQATQHANPSYTVGRGNLYITRRWDVADPDNWGQVVSARVGYYTTGAVHFTQTDGPNGVEQATFDYADKFSDGNSTPVNYNTFAYPTKVTDPDGFFSEAEYRYDFGAPVKATGPPPQGQSQGAIVRRQYDSIGRLEKVRTEFNGNPDYSYTRWTYPSTNEQISQYTTITDGAGEAYAFTQTDGLGRPLRQATEHPGSIGGYSTVATEYDALGRAWKQSVPTETDQFTNPAGDDSLGYLYRQQTFDWKGRPLVTTNTDGTQTEAQYGGCGCAGGEVVTILGEDLAPPTVPPAPPNPPKRRKQVVYSDFLGRTVKAESYNWPAPYGDGAVYSSTMTEYNARDQVRFVKQYAGAATGTPGLQSERQYDGHGRVWKQYAPPMLPGTWTTFAYNANDTVQSVTDARDVTVNYLYNARRLVTNVSYSAPAAITASVPLSFQYDAAGNRTQMVDGIGTNTYNYDQFSRLTSEAKPLPDFSSQFNVGYEYSRAGQLKSVTDHFGQKVSYGFDNTGRLSTVNSANNWGGGANTTVISGRNYRAFGALKQESYGSGYTATATHNARLQVSAYTLTGANQQPALQYAHQYSADGALKFSDNQLNGIFDRAYQYDQAGRMTAAYTGPEANDINNGVPVGTYYGLPYREQFQYDALNQLTATTQSFWGASAETTPTSYLNGRIAGWTYDEAGHVTQDGDGATYKYDAAGRLIEKTGSVTSTHGWYTYDGAGRMVKQVFTSVRQRPNNLPPLTLNRTTYYQGATALGGIALAEIDGNGAKTKGSVFVGGGLAATADNTGTVSSWQYNEPIVGAEGTSTNVSGAQFQPQAEYDPAGLNVGLSDPGNEGDGGVYVNDLLPGMGLGNECSNANPECTDVYMDGFRSDWATVINFARATGQLFLDTIRNGSFQRVRGTRETSGIAFEVDVDEFGNPIDNQPHNGTVVPGGELHTTIDSTFDRLLFLPIGLQEKKGQSPCEEQLARLFTDDPNTILVNILDGDDFDPVQNANRPPDKDGGNVHNHIYNNPFGGFGEIFNRTNIFAPGGGTIIDSGKTSDGQNFTSIYYPKFGTEKDVVLEIYHLENFNRSLVGTRTTGARSFVGQMGPNGDFGYLVLRETIKFPWGPQLFIPMGYHIHLTATKKWWKGNYVRSGPRATAKHAPYPRNNTNVNLSTLCR
jgi:YD repeat-containing protein